MSSLAAAVSDWYALCARDLPWRRPGTAPWGVLVSEVMLQQTPVSRVVPAWTDWLARWPGAAELAAPSSAEAVRQWGRLGYPGRALRLHETARSVVDRHGGEVPTGLADLLALPGLGPYSARAVAAFAHRQRHAVVDTNVRRVVARAVRGEADGGPPSASRDLRRVEPLLPEDPDRSATFGVAVMELGALVCTARAPRCPACPLQTTCAWRAAGYPPSVSPAPRRQAFAGTDRQVRGRLLAVLRDAPRPVLESELDAVWDEPVQRTRALAALAADGLAARRADGRWSLPGA